MYETVLYLPKQGGWKQQQFLLRFMILWVRNSGRTWRGEISKRYRRRSLSGTWLAGKLVRGAHDGPTFTSSALVEMVWRLSSSEAISHGTWCSQGLLTWRHRAPGASVPMSKMAATWLLRPCLGSHTVTYGSLLVKQPQASSVSRGGDLDTACDRRYVRHFGQVFKPRQILPHSKKM